MRIREQKEHWEHLYLRRPSQSDSDPERCRNTAEEKDGKNSCSELCLGRFMSRLQSGPQCLGYYLAGRGRKNITNLGIFFLDDIGKSMPP